MRLTLCLLALLAAAPLRAETAPFPTDKDLALQQVVRDKLDPIFVTPETTRWQFEPWKPFRSGSELVCGHVSYMNSGRVYSPFQPFYAIIRRGTVTESGILGNRVQDPTGATRFAYETVCTQP
jgi:hypothetical protein